MLFSRVGDEKLKKAFELYNEEYCKILPSKEQLGEIGFSEVFDTKMQKLLQKQKKAYYYMINTVGKRAAIIILSLLIALSTVTFGVKAIRETVIEFITETYEKFTRITVESEDTPDEIDLEPFKPQYVPEGFEIISENNHGTMYSIMYENSQKQSIFYTQQLTHGADFRTNTEGVEFDTIFINSFEGIIYEQKGEKHLIFATQDYFFIFSGNISFDELIKMAESIEIK